jgi:tetratricopeptide (TPR) repeat protein
MLLNAGNAKIGLKDFKGAAGFLEKAKMLSPQNASIRVSLGYAHAMRNKLDVAIAEIREAIRLEPKNEQVQYFLGNLYLANRDRDAAIAQQRKVHALSPELARKLFQTINSDKLVVVPSDALGFRP